MPVIPLDDPRDVRVSLYRGVSDPVLLREHGAFVAEGRLVVRRLLTASPLRPMSVLVIEPARAALDDVLSIRPDLPIYVAPRPVLNEIAGFDIHRGCLALGARPAPRRWQDVLDPTPAASRLVVLEAVSNADNIGGIFRSASALGAAAVLLGPGCCDPLYRKAIRTSMGATLEMPFAAAAPWPEMLADLRGHGVRLVALAPDGVLTIDEAVGQLQGARRVALLAGAEGDGLTAAALAAADLRVRIPMASGIDSLNVTVAVGIALHRLGDGK